MCVLGGRSVHLAAMPLSDPEFEKEAWLSMVMLEWGSCGQLAVQCTDSSRTAAETNPRRATSRASGTRSTLRRVRCRGRALSHRAGQRRRRAAHLAGRRIRRQGNESLPRSLIAAVVGDLVRRGVRALEAFGRTAEAAELLDPRMLSPELRPSSRCSATVRSSSA